ncbi:hypothetical protein [Pantoea sp. Cy-640]|jgi:hypothetical protein|uniref:hypothetical protein n=1 Tax=Pantoea sp. Cy-640 TaxID=2608353 RepID=UPI0014196786|nr:hypothetical protein [Pantoea sp. Cy-640]NIG14488.1 hypothetical protein [Pantoea sp. Cy-640]
MPKKCAAMIKHYLACGDDDGYLLCEAVETRPRQPGIKPRGSGLNSIYAVTLTLIIQFKNQAG